MRHFFILAFALVVMAGSVQAQYKQKLIVQFTRPANATAYTAGDVVCATDSLPLAFSTNLYSAGKVTFAKLVADTANTANGTFRLWLYSDSTGMGKIADNAAFANSPAYDSLSIGFISFTLENAGQAGGTASVHVNMAPGLEYSVGGGKAGLFGRLIATGGYVPKNGGTIEITLDVERK